jgi:Protein of unknown function (DUF3618)
VISGRIDELEHQIGLTRRALDRTLNDLQRRLSPRYQLQSAWGSTRKSAIRAYRRSAHWAGCHPFLVLGMGVTVSVGVYLFMRGRER